MNLIQSSNVCYKPELSSLDRTFQVVDMRWGVRDEATDDHMTTELCMKEIENCQRLSMGPNFVVMNLIIRNRLFCTDRSLSYDLCRYFSVKNMATVLYLHTS